MRGLRIAVQSVLELLASGVTLDEVLVDYPYLEREDLLAVLEYGAATSGSQQVVASQPVRFLVVDFVFVNAHRMSVGRGTLEHAELTTYRDRLLGELDILATR